MLRLAAISARRLCAAAAEGPFPVSEASALTITERCAERLRALGKVAAKPVALRVAVDGGGCSGFQYAFSIEPASAPSVTAQDATTRHEQPDLVFDTHGAVVKVDPISFSFIRGARVDYVDELISSSFRVVDNPNSESSCGCGTSFAAKP
jgi:iron-sulfur cluster assembly accessory protein